MDLSDKGAGKKTIESLLHSSCENYSEIDLDSDKLKEKCAVFGAYNLEGAARITYFGLYALQHRGQESSGIACFNGAKIHVHKREGLVTQVYQEDDFLHLTGSIAVGHNRYSTSGGTSYTHVQPVHYSGEDLALVHNGNLPSTTLLENFLLECNVDISTLNDSEMMYKAIYWYKQQGFTLEESVAKAYPLFTGVFCLLVMDQKSMVAVVDPHGIRPLCLGKLNGGWVFASESCALYTVNAEFVKEIDPGEMVVLSGNEMHTIQLTPGNRKLDIFEFVYFARPDSNILGKNVYEVRLKLGKALATEFPVKADVVIPVPESAIPAAIGYATESGIPFQMGLIKNRYIGRTFIMPDQKMRDNGVRMKLHPIPELIRGKKVIIVDDSIVRGTTIKKIVSMLRGVGAKEVHVMVSSPRVRYPDFYGINTPTQEELIGAHLDFDEITKVIGADSVNYLSLEGMIGATNLPSSMFCTSCFTGEYPIDIKERNKEIHFYPTPKL